MTTALRDLNNTRLDLQPRKYTYDQLHRITGMYSYVDQIESDIRQFGWNGDQTSSIYGTKYSYDANGNLKTLFRNSAEGSMDELIYDFNNNQNLLRYIEDGVDDAGLGDISDRDYTGSYDASGNLIMDINEGIEAIEWNHFGKIKKIYKGKKTISFIYDAMGNRVIKDVYDPNSVRENNTTYYMRDAAGNVMATYESRPKAGSEEIEFFEAKEFHIYGSSRLGMLQLSPSIDMLSNSIKGLYLRRAGQRRYELTNHLGNVLSVITDNKISESGHNNGEELLSLYRPEVVSYSEYYPFGWQMPSRTGSIGSYRYGFNGKEKDDEVKGDGVQYDYGFRIYDS
ncbi:MAG TPA: hypothetical protein PK147_11640, partial [Saprospiraceae bacterium]|nr:hypothetical protein [Saprospiraceae bacterium]